MYQYIKHTDDHIFGMADVNPKKSGLSVHIWSDHGGVKRKVAHKNTPRVKISKNDDEISVSIEPSPKILVGSIPQKERKNFNEGIEYVGRNYDIFKQHYYDTTDDFDDEDLFDNLRSRGEYK